MPRKFSSYLIRWWRSDESERLELEHIQSGRKQLAASVEDALAWLHDQQSAETESQPTGSDHEQSSESSE